MGKRDNNMDTGRTLYGEERLKTWALGGPSMRIEIKTWTLGPSMWTIDRLQNHEDWEGPLWGREIKHMDTGRALYGAPYAE